MRRELSLAMKDLRYVGVVCKVCNTEVIVDMASTYKPDADMGKGFAPDHCPTCNTAFDSAVKPALDRFQGVYAALVKVQDTVSFRVLSLDAQER
jgi:hypothetical protein